MTTTVTFRPAGEKDARHIAELINIASSDLEVYDWERDLTTEKQQDGVTVWDVGMSHILNPDHYFHYSNAIMAVQGDKVVGLLLTYPIEQKTEEDRAKLSPEDQVYHDLKQNAVGYFYIDSLAIYPEYQGMGIGAQLLDYAVDMARDRDFQNICLLAYEENYGAVRLYERNGFRNTHQAPVIAMDYMPYSGHVLLLEKTI